MIPKSSEILEKFTSLQSSGFKNAVALKNTKSSNVRFAFDKNCELFYMVNTSRKVDTGFWLGEIQIYKLENENLVAKQVKIGEVSYQYEHFYSAQSVIYIRDIEVYKNYKERAIGSYALKFCEEIAYDFGCKKIEGKFYPHNETDEEALRNFYEKNKYSVLGEGDERTIEKVLTKSNLSAINNNTLLSSNNKIYGPIEMFSEKENISEII